MNFRLIGCLIVSHLLVASSTGYITYGMGATDGRIEGERAIVHLTEAMEATKVVRAFCDLLKQRIAKDYAFTMDGRLYPVPFTLPINSYKQRKLDLYPRIAQD